MTVVFVVDTSASMNQRCSNGLSLLDCAKSAVEHFLKLRIRDPTWHRADRYLLVTCEDGPNAIKVVDKFPFVNFTRVLKTIEAHDLTETSGALQHVFDFLHLQRLANDVDRFGQGRNPCSIEPTTILLLTDGTELSTKAGVLQTIAPTGSSILGSDLCTKSYRWDQRVFAIVLRIPSVSQQVLERSGPLPQNAPISGSQTALAMDTDISAFCDSTGGKCFVATSWKILMQHIEVTSRLSTCVVVSFENMPLPGATAPPPQIQAACQRKLLFIRANQPHQGHWPIPEAYWPDPSQPSPPPRDSHPMISYRAVEADPFIPAQFIYDKYDIEFNPIVNFLSKTPGAVWQVFIRNSKGPSCNYGDPFGFLRLYGNALNLYVLPYNYPVLWNLLDQVTKFPKATSMPQWRQEMERYCSGIPCYYGPPLKAALRQWGIAAHVETLEKSLSAGFVGNQLKRLKAQAKTESDIMTERLGNTNVPSTKTHERVFPVLNCGTAPSSFVFATPSFSVRLLSSSASEPVLGQKFHEVSVPAGPSLPKAAAVPPLCNENHPKVGNEGTCSFKDAVLFKNPFDVPRDDLLSQLKYLPVRVALAVDARTKGSGKPSSLRTLAARIVAKEEEEARHTVPIEKMGDFSEALFKQQPPRNPFADEQERNKQQRSLFGNPYRQEKNDAADEAWLEGGGPQSRGRKRRRRSESPSSSGASTSSASAGESSGGGANEVNSPSKRLLDVKVQKDALSDMVDGIAQPSGRYPASDEPDLNLVDGSSLVPQRYGSDSTQVEEAARQRIKRGNEFVLAALRALKHARPNSTDKLFELLSAPEFPVDKARLLEQLIHQAHCYKNTVVATELADYRNKFLASQAQTA